MNDPSPPAGAPPATLRAPGRSAALAGVVAAAAALGVAELTAGLVAAVPSLVVTVGQAFIRIVPEGISRTAISLFGTADKAVLITGIGLVAAAFGALLGRVGRRDVRAAGAGFAAFAVLGVAAAAALPDVAVGPAAGAAVVAAVTGFAVLWWLLRAATPNGQSADESPAPRAGGQDRRAFLRLAGTGLMLSGLAAVTGRWLAGRTAVVRARSEVVLPAAAGAAPQVPDGAEAGIDGLTPWATPNDDFYRIDTALSVPQVDPASWTLRVHGMVDRPFEITYDELLAQADSEAWITLSCVSNQIGGSLVGNARWQGVPLADLLERAGVQVGATQIVGRSVDGFTVGFPTAALDDREALVAVGMNGAPLPAAHGFPARLVVAGLYGYVSATKWLSDIELVPLDAFDAYWIPRGWAKEAPVKTQSRIDVPRHGADLTAGKQVVAGVAWAPSRGISGVEVRIGDDGQWQPARLGDGVGDDTWRQWVFDWDAAPGEHAIAVRAADGDGEVQTEERAPVMPDGATGYHVVRVDVA